MELQKIIVHLDMDAFFASVEERYTPAFRGKPIAVGSDPKNGRGRGVISTANYKAREYGIHSAMPITKAWEASENARKQGKEPVIFLPVDFELYNKSSAAILNIIQRHTDLVEQASIDEFYFDLSNVKTLKKAEQICKKIKAEIRTKEKITCSIGIAPNRFIAKIAAGKNKPDGLLIVRHSEVKAFLEPLPIREIPGIGPKTAELLYKKAIFTVKDLKRFSKNELKNLLGKWGEELYDKALGRGSAEIIENREIKSIGEQNTFYEDTFDIIFLSGELNAYCTRVFNRFLESGFAQFKTISITVRFSNFHTVSATKSFPRHLGEPDLEKFKFEALKLLLPFLDKRKNPYLQKIRLLGVKIENLQHQIALL